MVGGMDRMDLETEDEKEPAAVNDPYVAFIRALLAHLQTEFNLEIEAFYDEVQRDYAVYNELRQRGPGPGAAVGADGLARRVGWAYKRIGSVVFSPAEHGYIVDTMLRYAGRVGVIGQKMFFGTERYSTSEPVPWSLIVTARTVT